jgi:hypothetical protein
MNATASPMKEAPPEKLDVDPRYLDQNARLAIQDVYDALIELITNADDRYEFLGRDGEIHIEVERRRKGEASIIRIRDFADGMTIETMRNKLRQVGKRVSGMAQGYSVRGTNSRGAKDVAVLGGVVFDSIAEDGKYHKCRISSRIEFIPSDPSVTVTPEIRKSLKISQGTGTLVTLTVDPSHRVPRHDQLCRSLPDLVALRDILGSKKRRVILRDLNQEREEQVRPFTVEGHERLKARFSIPNYPGAEAKLVVLRAKKRFEAGQQKFRQGGILIKSRHAIHEATYFAPELEHDPYAAWFFGKLTCEYIDVVWNEYDERYEKGLNASPINPYPIFDPLRKAGMRRDHPFTKALFGEALKRFRPLIDEERKREEKERVRVENEQTRKRLNTLRVRDSKMLQKGFILNPPFAQVVQGNSMRFWLNVKREAFPELSTEDSVEISCLTDEISTSKHYAQLEPHPTQQEVLRAIWTVKGERPTKATGVKVRVGPIVAESHIEVLFSEKDKYDHVKTLCFHRKRYTVIVRKARTVDILAPHPSLIERPTPIAVACSSKGFRITGEQLLLPHPELGVAICKLRIHANEPDCCGTLVAQVGTSEALAEISSVLPSGSPINIELKDDSFENQRSKWHGNTLQIATRHPSLRRYLGPPKEFLGQDEKHFRVLLAEIVAEAVCQRILGKRISENPEEFQDADWDLYYSEYTKLTTEFLPIAHETQVREV